MRNTWKPTIIKVNGKKFIQCYPAQNIQCAYCLFLQPEPKLNIIRNKNGLIKLIELELRDESHSDSCIQKYSKTNIFKRLIEKYQNKIVTCKYCGDKMRRFELNDYHICQ